MKREILAIIPARGGSKGLPRKNIKELNGIPLIGYTILSAINSKYVSRVVVTTDDEQIVKIAIEYGAEVPYLRPKELSKDSSSTIEAVLHLINYLQDKESYFPDYILLLQCTSPLRNTIHIDEAVDKLLNSNFEGIVSICEAEVNPYWTNVLVGDKLEYFIKEGKEILGRQQLPKIYRINGAIFLVKIEALERENTFEVDNLTAYIMDEYSSIDIDNEIDFYMAEAILKMRENKL